MEKKTLTERYLEEIKVRTPDKDKIPTLYIMVGIQGSGKSSYAKELAKLENCEIHSTDAVRVELYGDQLNSPNDKLVFRTVRERIKADLELGKNVICDACNVTKSKRASFLNEIHKVKCKKVAVVVSCDVKTCIERNDARPDNCRVPKVSIYTAAKRYEEPSIDEGFDEITYINSDKKEC